MRIIRESRIAAVVTKELQEIYETAVWSVLSLNGSEQY